MDHSNAVSFENNVATVMKSSCSLRDLRGVEVFVLVRRHSGVKVRNEGRDCQVVVAVIGGPE